MRPGNVLVCFRRAQLSHVYYTRTNRSCTALKWVFWCAVRCDLLYMPSPLLVRLLSTLVVRFVHSSSAFKLFPRLTTAIEVCCMGYQVYAVLIPYTILIIPNKFKFKTYCSLRSYLWRASVWNNIRHVMFQRYLLLGGTCKVVPFVFFAPTTWFPRHSFLFRCPSYKMSSHGRRGGDTVYIRRNGIGGWCWWAMWLTIEHECWRGGFIVPCTCVLCTYINGNMQLSYWFWCSSTVQISRLMTHILQQPKSLLSLLILFWHLAQDGW